MALSMAVFVTFIQTDKLIGQQILKMERLMEVIHHGQRRVLLRKFSILTMTW